MTFGQNNTYNTYLSMALTIMVKTIFSIIKIVESLLVVTLVSLPVSHTILILFVTQMSFHLQPIDWRCMHLAELYTLLPLKGYRNIGQGHHVACINLHHKIKLLYWKYFLLYMHMHLDDLFVPVPLTGHLQTFSEEIWVKGQGHHSGSQT